METELKRKVRKKNPRYLEELWEFSRRGWHLICVKIVKDLYASLPRGFEIIIQAKRSHAKCKQYTVTSSNEHYVINFQYRYFSVIKTLYLDWFTKGG